jgi:N-[(2S)-2-amino-2-carboxyethyl]-L-glutamate dehydrogenase
MNNGIFDFAVIPGNVVSDIIRADYNRVIDIVEQAYHKHGAGETVNPPSLFLRFPDRPNARIITLPAHLGGDDAVTGMKWVASFPDNIVQGIPRASAVLLLNHPDTGYPFACEPENLLMGRKLSGVGANLRC